MGRESSMTRELSKTVAVTDDSEVSEQDLAYQSAIDCLRHWLVEIDDFRDRALVLGLNQFARIIDDARTRSEFLELIKKPGLGDRAMDVLAGLTCAVD